MIALEDEDSLSGNSRWRQRITTERRFQILNIVVVVVVGIIVIAVVSAMYANTKALVEGQKGTGSTSSSTSASASTSGSDIPVVDNPVLKELSTYMLGVMDKNVDPCDNFYEYACGTWIKNTQLPADKSSQGLSFSTLQDRAMAILKEVLEEGWPMIGPFYQNCMDVVTLNELKATPIQPFLDQIDAITDVTSLVKMLAKLHRLSIDGGAFFSFFVETDSIDPSVYLATLWQGGLGLPSRDYYFATDATSVTLRSAYQTHISNSLQLIGMSASNASAFATQIIAFETALAAASLSPVQMRDPNLVYNKMSIAQLKTITAGYPWDDYFATLGVPTISYVNVGVPNFTQSMANLTIMTDIGLLKIYMKWHLLSSTSSLLSEDFEDEAFAWSKTLYGVQEPTPRWKQCASWTNSLLSDVLSRYYVERAFPGSSKTIAQKLVDGLEFAFDENLKDVNWMDPTTKNGAKKKLSMITNKIGYPDVWKSYDSVFVQPGQFFDNVLQLSNLSTTEELAKIGKPVDRTTWYMTPSTVNAYYNPSMNEIVFPAAILQPPFFNASHPAFANFGGIGAVIGHEITHAFDDSGKEFDGTGNLTDWWTPGSESAFLQKAQCVVDRYSNFEVLPGLFINGQLTEGENVADLGGLRIAYNAYLNWIKDNGEGITEEEIQKYFPGFTTKQLFFLTFGQIWCDVSTDDYLRYLTLTNPHSADKFRVIGAASNLDAFWEAFSCPVGTTMHPQQECRVW